MGVFKPDIAPSAPTVRTQDTAKARAIENSIREKSGKPRQKRAIENYSHRGDHIEDFLATRQNLVKSIAKARFMPFRAQSKKTLSDLQEKYHKPEDKVIIQRNSRPEVAKTTNDESYHTVLRSRYTALYNASTKGLRIRQGVAAGLLVLGLGVGAEATGYVNVLPETGSSQEPTTTADDRLTFLGKISCAPASEAKSVKISAQDKELAGDDKDYGNHPLVVTMDRSKLAEGDDFFSSALSTKDTNTLVTEVATTLNDGSINEETGQSIKVPTDCQLI